MNRRALLRGVVAALALGLPALDAAAKAEASPAVDRFGIDGPVIRVSVAAEVEAEVERAMAAQIGDAFERAMAARRERAAWARKLGAAVAEAKAAREQAARLRIDASGNWS